jgi:hypothetical protein
MVRTPVVLVAPHELSIKRLALSVDRVVPVFLAPLRDSEETPSQPLPNGSNVNRETPLPVPSTDVRKPQDLGSQAHRHGKQSLPSIGAQN